MSLILLCLMFYPLQLITTVKKPINFVVQTPSSRFRRQDFLPPKRSELYNPNYGFEPYWPDGGWVFDRLEITTEGKEGTICGNNCLDMYKEFGVICGRDKDYNLKTFNNYCELLNEDCTGKQKWLIVYRGVCVTEHKFYPIEQSKLFTRASEYEYLFQLINPTKYRPNKTSLATSTTKK